VRTRTFLITLALAMLTVAVSGCGASAPPTPASAPGAGSGKQAGPYTVSLTGAPNPAVRGSNALEAIVTDASGQPVSDAKVTLDLNMTNMNMGKYTVVATPAGSGRYTSNVSYSMAGPWRVTVTVERAGQAAASAHFDFSVNQR
jgi:uncharacterized iron-regulated membrane protein